MFELQYRFINESFTDREGILATFRNLKEAEKFKKVYEQLNNHEVWD